jgi:hypothetical protein
MPEVSNDNDLRRLAAAVRSREQFEAVFDQTRTPDTSFPFKLLALLDSAQPYLKALLHAQEKSFIGTLVERLMHADVLDFELLASAAESELTVTAQLQAITRPDLGFMNMALEIRGKLTASRRLCCITVFKPDLATPQASGTGFLVGPQIVLTSGHVLDCLVDATGSTVAGSHKRIRVVFDYVDGFSAGTVVPVQEGWLAGHSRLHPLEEQRQVLNWDDPPEAGFDQHLDFALLRLSRAVGYERGFYALDPLRMPVVDRVSGKVALLQHPAGQSQASAIGTTLRLWPPSFKSRMLHDANSVPGSSGGLLVDSEFQPVGLHQCSYVDAQNNPLYNGAIPTAHIAGLNLPLSQVQGLDPIWKLKDTKEAVIGREDFQGAVLDALEGRVRVLTVAGGDGMGRSFSTKILREMLGSAEHQVVEFSASKLPVTARGTAQAILAEISEQARGVTLPDTGEAESAQAAWISQELLPAFIRAFATAAAKRTVWLVIDDIDRYPVANTSTRVFLESVYAGMAAIPQLRIVLIGFRGVVPGALPGLVRGEVLNEFSVIELIEYIDRESTALDIPRLAGQSQSIAVQLLEEVQAAPDDQRQALLARRVAAVTRMQ